MSCFPWHELRLLVGTEMKTLGTVEIFKILRIDDVFIWIRPRGGSTKEIAKGALDEACHLLKAGKVMELRDLNVIQEKRASYMAALLAHSPSIDHDSNPVRVWWKGNGPGARKPVAPPVRLVGNVLSLKYHWPDCKFAPRPEAKHFISFQSAAEARARGYSPCRVCDPGP